MKGVLLTLFLSFFLVYSTDTYGQDYLHWNKSFDIDSSTSVVHNQEQEFTSVLFKGDQIDHVELEANNRNYRLSNYIDKHSPTKSALIVFKNPIRSITILSEVSQNFQMDLFYTPSLEINLEDVLNKKTDCEKPTTVSYEVWREGLPAPKPGRMATVVKHCIIHHTAGSNDNDDYVNVVRNIYVAHTQVNGWDDIGYNYLIAQDGTIFSGRDPQNVADEDNVQGAHYCAKNGGTLGVALLGNYELTSPSQEAINSLTELLTWKLFKEGLFPFQSFPHPSSLDDHLGSIAIHKDGCNTSCPGDSLELLLEDIKSTIEFNLRNCGKTTYVENNTLFNQPLIYPNPSNGILHFDESLHNSSFEIINTLGKIETSGLVSNSNSLIPDLKQGTYYIKLKTEEGRFKTLKFILIN